MPIAYLSSAETSGPGAGGGATGAFDSTGATLLVAAVSRTTSSGTLTDNQSNTWTQLTTKASTGVESELYYCLNPNTNAAHTVSYTGGNTYPAVVAAAYSGAGIIYDQEAVADANATSVSCGSLTPSGDGALVISFCAHEIGEAQTNDASMTERHDRIWVFGVELGIAYADIVQGAAAAINPNWSSAASDWRIGHQATFYIPSTTNILTIDDGVVQNQPVDGILALRGDFHTKTYTVTSTLNLELVPGGLGALVVTTDGDTRGEHAIDLQKERSVSTMVASGDNSFIGGGEDNTASAAHASVVGGQTNAVSSAHSIICGGSTNVVSTSTYAAVVGGLGNDITSTSTYSSICGGTDHTITASIESTICGGLTNNINASPLSTIAGGARNDITATSNTSTIVGGEDGLIDASTNCTINGGSVNTITIGCIASTVGGGVQNDIDASVQATIAGGNGGTIHNGRRSTIGGGITNTITAGTINIAQQNFLGGGDTNDITDCQDCAIAGGDTNSINASSQSSIAGGNLCAITTTSTLSFIGGGYTNTIDDSLRCVIGGGWINGISNSADYCVIGGGRDNSIAASQYCQIGGGRGNAMTGSGDYNVICGGQLNVGPGTASYTSILGGLVNAVEAQYCVAQGGYSVAALYGESAQASGRLASNGDAQTSVLVARNTTTDATVTSLFLDGSAAVITVPTNTLWTFSAMISGFQDTGAAGAGYKLEGVIARDGSAGAALIGTPIKTVLGETTASWDATADASANTLRLRVTGQAGTNINWVARIEVTQVTSGA